MTTATIDRPTLTPRRPEPTKGPYAPVPYCDEHTRRHQAGCAKCKRYAAWKDRVWRRCKELGQPVTVPAAEVIGHLQNLHTRGMTPSTISTASGVPASTIRKLLYCGADRKFVQARAALPLLAVPVPAEPVQLPPKRELVGVAGSLRRLRALARIGWTYRHVAEAAGADIRMLDELARQQWITGDNAHRIARAYDRLSMQRGPSQRTAARAARAGWAPPLAWDEATIDDPDAQPVVDAEASETDTFDPITVALAVDGRLTHAQLIHHRPDLIETVRRLAQRMTDVEIAHHLHWPGSDDGPPGKTRGQNNVGQLRHRHGIPGPERFEAVYAYRPGGKRARNDKAA